MNDKTINEIKRRALLFFEKILNIKSRDEEIAECVFYSFPQNRTKGCYHPTSTGVSTAAQITIISFYNHGIATCNGVKWYRMPREYKMFDEVDFSQLEEIKL